mmetsp:Transcript_1373/g.3289  ORF Transcript_1373/g.3289 Transcript_1373/m.3289 type:complete len:236 (+) Transcript_1373:1620-2327(+)
MAGMLKPSCVRWHTMDTALACSMDGLACKLALRSRAMAPSFSLSEPEADSPSFPSTRVKGGWVCVPAEERSSPAPCQGQPPFGALPWPAAVAATAACMKGVGSDGCCGPLAVVVAALLSSASVSCRACAMALTTPTARPCLRGPLFLLRSRLFSLSPKILSLARPKTSCMRCSLYLSCHMRASTAASCTDNSSLLEKMSKFLGPAVWAFHSDPLSRPSFVQRGVYKLRPPMAVFS